MRFTFILLLAECLFINRPAAQQPVTVSAPAGTERPADPAKKATANADAWVNITTRCYADFDACLAACRANEESACGITRMMAGGRFHEENPALYRELALADCAKNAPGCFLSAWSMHYYDDGSKKHRWKAELVKEMMQSACDHEVKEACPLAKDPDSFPRRNVTGDQPKPPESVKPPKPAAQECTSTPVDTSLIYSEVEVDAGAKLISRVEPHYPDAMRQKGQEGAVAMVAVVDENGAVTGIGKLGGGSREFLDAGAAAVLRWRYEPARKCGVPVAVCKMVTVIFLLH